jgi:hypothetical protein
MGRLSKAIAPASRRGWVYILTNRAMPGLVKIGCTRRSPEDRVRELSSATGVPAPFEVAWAWPVSDWKAVEALTHNRLGVCRPNPDREFFSCSVRRARREIRRMARAYLRPAWLRLLVGPRRPVEALSYRRKGRGPAWKRPASNLAVPALAMMLLAAAVAHFKPTPPVWLPSSVRATVNLIEAPRVTVLP